MEAEILSYKEIWEFLTNHQIGDFSNSISLTTMPGPQLLSTIIEVIYLSGMNLQMKTLCALDRLEPSHREKGLSLNHLRRVFFEIEPLILGDDFDVECVVMAAQAAQVRIRRRGSGQKAHADQAHLYFFHQVLQRISGVFRQVPQKSGEHSDHGRVTRKSTSGTTT